MVSNAGIASGDSTVRSDSSAALYARLRDFVFQSLHMLA
jgi:hypothetical protein